MTTSCTDVRLKNKMARIPPQAICLAAISPRVPSSTTVRCRHIHLQAFFGKYHFIIDVYWHKMWNVVVGGQLGNTSDLFILSLAPLQKYENWSYFSRYI